MYVPRYDWLYRGMHLPPGRLVARPARAPVKRIVLYGNEHAKALERPLASATPFPVGVARSVPGARVDTLQGVPAAGPDALAVVLLLQAEVPMLEAAKWAPSVLEPHVRAIMKMVTPAARVLWVHPPGEGVGAMLERCGVGERLEVPTKATATHYAELAGRIRTLV